MARQAQVILQGQGKQHLVLLVVLIFGPLAGSIHSQGGYAKESHLRYGLKDLPVPKKWEALPVPPTEAFVALRWAECLPSEKSRQPRRRIRPTLELVSIPADPGGQKVEGENRTQASSPGSLVGTYMRGAWKEKGSVEVLEPSVGRQRFIRKYTSKHSNSRKRRSPERTAWLFEWRTSDRAQFLLGSCGAEDAEEMFKIWRVMATKVGLVEPREPDVSRWARYYEKRPNLRGPDFRLRVRARSAEFRDWKIVDTENYLILYSTKDQALVRLLKRELEAIRRAYEELFPTEQPLEVVSVLRVCRDREEYIAYGGSESSGGYWSVGAEELVFFDYEDSGRKRGSGKENSRVVLYHEAFHQYVHYAAGDIAPHAWFNEGTGDFFSGARFNGQGALSAIAENPWRVDTIVEAVELGQVMSLEDLFTASQRMYYARGGINYAQGWSLVYFLLTSSEVSRRPHWAKIHSTYYATLQEKWGSLRNELMALHSAGALDETTDELAESYLEAQEEARYLALEAALEGVDVDELERSWRAFVLDLGR